MVGTKPRLFPKAANERETASISVTDRMIFTYFFPPVRPPAPGFRW